MAGSTERGRNADAGRKAADLRREEKLARVRAEQAKQKRKRTAAIAAASVATVAIAGTLVTFALVQDPPPPAPADIQIQGLQTFSDLSRNHVTEPVQYPQNPPVGGDHAAAWLNCGVYSEPVPLENAVHDLEHGAVWVTYDPAVVDASQVEALRAELPDTFVLLSPLAGTASPIMLSAWGAQVGVDSVDDERIGDFVDKFWTSPDAPEPGAPCTGGIDAPGRVA